MNKKLKRGFTIVELVIVIAVIGILAGILIPMFSNLVTKANVASDGVLVRELNNAIAMDAEVNGKHETIHDALKATDEYGFNVQRINAKASQNKILWDSKNDVFCYLKDGVIEYISFSGEESQQLQAGDYRLWVIANNVDADYSTYLYNYTGNGVIETSKGLDVGEENVTSVTYSHTGPVQIVDIRTNGGTLTIEAPNDDVYHYGYADSVNIKSVANSSYHAVDAEIKFLEIAGGHVVLEEQAKVNAVHFTATGEGDAAKFENAQGKKISIDLSKVSEEAMPTFTRDAVVIEENGTYVAEVKTESTEYIWLFGQGIKEQMVVSSTTGAIAQNGTLKAGVEVGAEDGSVAEQIANPAKRNGEGQLLDENDEVIDLTNVDLKDATALEDTVVFEEAESKDVIEAKAISGLTGTGKERDPYKIYTYEQYVCLINLQGSTTHSSGATIYHVGKIDTSSKPEKTYITFEADIDFEWNNPFKNASDRLYEYNLSIDGKGHVLTRVYGAIFNAYNENNTYRFWDYEIKNLTLDDFYGSYYGTAMGYAGAYNSTGTCTFENITVNYNSSSCSWYGSMLGWTGASPIVFKDCHVNNADVRGGSGMCIGGFVGNGQNIVFDGCTFMGKVTSDSENAGGFVGQGGNNVVIRDCEVLAGSTIKNKKAGGTVQAFGTANKELSNNKFNGVLVCDKKANARQSDTWSKADGIPAGTFVIDENGQIYYMGTGTVAKVEIRITYAIDRLMTTANPVRFDGYMPSIVEINEYNNVESGAQFANVTQITNVINVVDANYVSNVYNGSTDSSVLIEENRLGETLFYRDGSTVYVDGRGENPAFYSGCAKYSNGELVATDFNSGKAVLIIYAYDQNGNELGINTLTYNFAIAD